jgi:hypothetical protein
MFLPVTEEEKQQVEEIKERLNKRHLHSDDIKHTLENQVEIQTVEETSDDNSAEISIDKKQIYHVDSHCCSDIKILRFLRGRKHNIEHAFKSLQRHLLWRKENEIDKIEFKDIKDITDKKFVNTDHKDKGYIYIIDISFFFY